MEQVKEAVQQLTFEEYIELERRTGVRHEFYNGEAFAMAGESTWHNEIAQNIAFALRAEFRPRGCRVFINDVKQEFEHRNYYVYPDVILTCHPADQGADYIVRHPSIIVEVLSKSTQGYDLTVKLRRYRQLPSLRYLLFVSQKEYLVQCYSRGGGESLSHFQDYAGADDVLRFDELGYALPLRVIYEGIGLEPEGT